MVRLVSALAEENNYPVAELYRLEYTAFELAIDLMKDWRLDRYYAERIRLFDVVLAAGQSSEYAATAGARDTGYDIPTPIDPK